MLACLLACLPPRVHAFLLFMLTPPAFTARPRKSSLGLVEAMAQSARPVSARHNGIMARVVARCTAAALLLLSFQRPAQALDVWEGSPPVYGAYPTGGPVDGGTSVTIFGSEFDRINNFLSEARCSWGDPRDWQQAIFAAQQANPPSQYRPPIT